MLAGTDGLPPWLDIDRFHVSRRPFTPYPTAMVQGSVYSLLVKEDIQVGTTSPTLHVAVAAPNLFPSGVRRKVRKNLSDIRVTNYNFIPFSQLTTYPGLNPLNQQHLSALVGRLGS